MTNKITYTQQGDYLLPDLKLPEQPKVKIGIWGCGSPVETSAAGRSTDRAGRRDHPAAFTPDRFRTFRVFVRQYYGYSRGLSSPSGIHGIILL